MKRKNTTGIENEQNSKRNVIRKGMKGLFGALMVFILLAPGVLAAPSQTMCKGGLITDEAAPIWLIDVNSQEPDQAIFNVVDFRDNHSYCVVKGTPEYITEIDKNLAISDVVGDCTTVTISEVPTPTPEPTPTETVNLTLELKKGRNVFSLPMNVTIGQFNNTVWVSNNSNEEKWDMYDPALPGFDSLKTINRGQIVIINSTSKQQLFLVGDKDDSEFSTQLYTKENEKAAVNFFGNPFNRSVSIAAITLEYGGEFKNLQEAYDAGWLRSPHVFDENIGLFTDMLDPRGAYRVYAAMNVILHMKTDSYQAGLSSNAEEQDQRSVYDNKGNKVTYTGQNTLSPKKIDYSWGKNSSSAEVIFNETGIVEQIIIDGTPMEFVYDNLTENFTGDLTDYENYSDIEMSVGANLPSWTQSQVPIIGPYIGLKWIHLYFMMPGPSEVNIRTLPLKGIIIKGTKPTLPLQNLAKDLGQEHEAEVSKLFANLNGNEQKALDLISKEFGIPAGFVKYVKDIGSKDKTSVRLAILETKMPSWFPWFLVNIKNGAKSIKVSEYGMVNKEQTRAAIAHEWQHNIDLGKQLSRVEHEVRGQIAGAITHVQEAMKSGDRSIKADAAITLATADRILNLLDPQKTSLHELLLYGWKVLPELFNELVK